MTFREAPIIIACLIFFFQGICVEAQKTDGELLELQSKLGVYKFTSPDFPATFAIVGGVSLALILAVIFIVVGLLSMEPNKDSIIYRMTTTRMKKD